MRRFVLDTNILLFYVRGHSVYKKAEIQCQLTSPDAFLIISAATKGELLSFAEQNNWGEKKMTLLEKTLDSFFQVDIISRDPQMMRAYADIDAYSQGKLTRLSSPFTSKNMGKNDLWIAAAAHVTGATLVTTDADFDHLDGVFIKLEKIPI
jgi:predicted nucleic acid-binding protein